MKINVFSVFVLTFLLAIPLVFAQGGGNGVRPMGARLYNLSTETTVQGTVESVVASTGRRGLNGTHLLVNAPGGTLEVHVGPEAYISNQNFAFAKGDAVEITGSKTTFNGKAIVIAREIRKGTAVLTLRDAQGFPKWSRAANR